MPDQIESKTWDRVINIGKYVLGVMILPALWWGFSIDSQVQILRIQAAQTVKDRSATFLLIEAKLNILKEKVQELRDARKTTRKHTVSLTLLGEKAQWTHNVN